MSVMDPFIELEKFVKAGKLPKTLEQVLHPFFKSYVEACGEESGKTLCKYLELIIEQIHNPYPFESFHQSIRKPFDYYQFGLDFIRPLILFKQSRIFGLNHVGTMQEQLAKGENVILLANHQTEPDPQVLSLFLEKQYPKIAEELISVAGHRVVNDPLAIPLSMGCSMLCIFSKKYMETPPEKKMEKQQHNQRVMKRMIQLLSDGGRCIYVAPSGGRDRPNRDGTVEVAHFDAKSIEMFWLMAQQAKHPTHFYPLALNTYNLLPPPHGVKIKLGEQRKAMCTPVHLSFGKEISMDHFPGSEQLDKKQKRQARADYIWELVNDDYHHLLLKPQA